MQETQKNSSEDDILDEISEVVSTTTPPLYESLTKLIESQSDCV